MASTEPAPEALIDIAADRAGGRRAGDGSAGSRSRPARRCRTRPGWPRCRASGSPCRRSPEPQPAAHLDPGSGRVTVLGDHRGQQLPLQLLQWCLADRGPPGGQHRSRGHGVRPLPRHAVNSPSSVVSTSRESASGITVISSTARMVQATLISRRATALIFRSAGRRRRSGRSCRPAAAVQFLLRGPEPGMITRPALRLDPSVPAHHRGRGHRHRAPHHRLARRDR